MKEKTEYERASIAEYLHIKQAMHILGGVYELLWNGHDIESIILFGWFCLCSVRLNGLPGRSLIQRAHHFVFTYFVMFFVFMFYVFFV